MKRWISLLLLVSLLFGLSACSLQDSNNRDESCFYYRRAEFAYGSDEGVVVPELRDITGHVTDLYYLMTLYLMGPMDEDLISPFPASTKLVSVHLAEDVLTIELTSVDKSLSDTEFSLACACLTKTCVELCDAPQVTIISGERSVTMNAEILLFYDDTIPEDSISEDIE